MGAQVVTFSSISCINSDHRFKFRFKSHQDIATTSFISGCGVRGRRRSSAWEFSCTHCHYFVSHICVCYKPHNLCDFLHRASGKEFSFFFFFVFFHKSSTYVHSHKCRRPHVVCNANSLTSLSHSLYPSLLVLLPKKIFIKFS